MANAGDKRLARESGHQREHRSPPRSRRSGGGQFLAVVATLDRFGGCDGTAGTGGVAAGREAGAVCAADRQGLSSSEACLGLNRRTGKRWRHGRTITVRDGRKLHYAPVVAAGAGRRVREISDRYLSEQERVRIADLRQEGHGVRVIAEQTGRSPSTISRELRRNQDRDSGQYRPFTAHKLAVRRLARPRPGKIAADPALRQFVQERLEKRWTFSGDRHRPSPRLPPSSNSEHPIGAYEKDGALVTATLIITVFAVFLAGAAAGIIVIVSAGIRREERRRHSLTRQSPGRASQGARLLTGRYVRHPIDPNPAAADQEHIHV